MRESSSTRASASIAAVALIAGALYTAAACSAVGPPPLGDPDEGTCTAGEPCVRTCDGACAVTCDDAATCSVYCGNGDCSVDCAGSVACTIECNVGQCDVDCRGSFCTVLPGVGKTNIQCGKEGRCSVRERSNAKATLVCDGALLCKMTCASTETCDERCVTEGTKCSETCAPGAICSCEGC